MFRRRETETETKERLLKLTDHNGIDETDIYIVHQLWMLKLLYMN